MLKNMSELEGAKFMEGKKCSKCGKIKPYTDFHKNNQTNDGLSCHCKECRKIYKAKIPKIYIAIDSKMCNTCRQVKPISEFYKDIRRKDGHKNDCAGCLRKNHEEYVLAGKRVVAEKVCRKCGELKLISKFHKDKSRYDGHRDVCRDCICKYPENHAEKTRLKILKSGNKKCTKCKRTKPLNEFYPRKEGELGYTSICKTCWSKKYADYYERNYEKIIEVSQRRLALEKKVECSFTENEWLECLAVFNYRCAYCGQASGKLQQDHFIPLSKLGPYTRKNIVPACPTCNRSKSNKDFDEWYKAQVFYSRERKEFVCHYLNCLKAVVNIE